MAKLILLLALICVAVVCTSQSTLRDRTQTDFLDVPEYDSLEKLVDTIKDDTSGANLLANVAYRFAFYRPEKGVVFAQRGIQLSNKIGYNEGTALGNRSLAMCLWGVGNYSKGLQVGLNALRLYEELNDQAGIAYTYYVIGVVYRDFGDFDRALEATQKGLSIYRELRLNDFVGHANLGSIYELQGNLDSALVNIQRSVDAAKKVNYHWPWLVYLQGNIWRKKKQFDSALYYYRAALPLVEEKDVVETYNGLAMLYRETGRIDSCIFYANEVVTKWKSVAYQRGILHATNILVDAYKLTSERDSVIKYLELSVALNNKLYSQESERNIQNMAFEEQTRQDELVREKERENARLRLYLILSAASVLLVIVLLLWRNNQHRRKAYEVLHKQKEETEKQKATAVQALNDLRAAQLQLIQSEKMASLGEMTAGIAHEIQNPLNFVNNFSEVNKELIEELKSELTTGNIQSANEIAETIKENEDKINHHGKRADGIVKGMLQHSRTSSGQKELTDINTLVEEYLRLAYHGLRAKDKSFNATFETDFDSSLPSLNVVRQDLGRVILNLINNAFYAVSEKRKHEQDGYEPKVVVSTKKSQDKIEIKVKDNGNGIPQKIMDKIFQPFFTTKPTGQGTGLGLSLSYDIIKAHGGEICLETKEGEGSEFIVKLPV